MSTGLSDTQIIQRRRRPPLWPWLLMPLVALAIFLGLRSARDEHPPAPARTGTAAQSPAILAPAQAEAQR